MQKLLILAGYTAYQARCLAPWLWFLLLAGVIASVVMMIDALRKGGESDEG